MVKQVTFYALWLLIVLCSMLLTWVVVHINPVTPNPFDAYKRYMPGATVKELRTSGDCENRGDDERYAPSDYLWCELDDGLVHSIAVTSVADDRIEGVYFFLVKCAVRAGDLTLWYDADIKALGHGMRLIAWPGGRSATWYPKADYWTPERCLWGVWFQSDL
jgi:hypothetical protein